mmetsp:Transcript_4598/g.7788  ORF Transcript_4598/g.7788 Transcript_4598/m.7788 type:complete len:93 (-) Transcript_4598:215-493(-)
MSGASSVGNPLSAIQTKLQNLRREKEITDSEIASLELEKNAIRKVIPKVLHELLSMREGIEAKQQELTVYDKAIQEIEKSYGHIIFSQDFFC